MSCAVFTDNEPMVLEDPEFVANTKIQRLGTTRQHLVTGGNFQANDRLWSMTGKWQSFRGQVLLSPLKADEQRSLTRSNVSSL